MTRAYTADSAVNLEGVAYGRVHGFFSKQSPGLYLPSPRRSRHACERGICSIAALNVGGACPTPAATLPTMLTCPSGRLLPTACAGPEGASRDRKAGLPFARSDVPPVSKVRARHMRCACSPRTHASASPVASACQAWPGQGAGGVFASLVFARGDRSSSRATACCTASKDPPPARDSAAKMCVFTVVL